MRLFGQTIYKHIKDDPKSYVYYAVCELLSSNPYLQNLIIIVRFRHDLAIYFSPLNTYLLPKIIHSQVSTSFENVLIILSLSHFQTLINKLNISIVLIFLKLSLDHLSFASLKQDNRFLLFHIFSPQSKILRI